MTLLECITARWSPTIGDASIMGWVTVAAYGLTAVLCALSFGRSPVRAHRQLGLVLTVGLLMLMVNKQLDLQSALTASGRCIAQMQGWYDNRRVVQFGFVIGILIIGVWSGAKLFWVMRGHLARTWPALFGVTFVLSFVAVRAIGFHHVDTVLNFRINNVRMNWVLELGGLVLISANAIWILIRPDIAPNDRSDPTRPRQR